MLLLVFPLVQGRDLGWPAWSFVMLAASVPALGGFVRHQLGRGRRGETPLVELSVFAKRSYASGVAFVVVFFGAVVGFSLAVGLFLQLGLGFSPTRASLTMAAWALGAFLGSGFSATMMAKLGRRIVHIGLSMMGAGTAALSAIVISAGTSVGSGHLIAPLVVFGAGMGMIFVPLFDIIMGDVEDREVGSASSLLESIQQLGASLGVAVLGTVFFAVAGPAATEQGLLDRASAVDAAGLVALLTLVLTVAAFALGFLLPRKARAHASEEAAAAPGTGEPELALAV
jgi:MFS family permease